MSPPGSRDGFEEDLSDLIELNGYDVVKISRSDDGGSEIIAAKTDEVGHKVAYLIHCRRSEAPIDDAEVEGIAKARERYPGSICVIVSPSSGFSRSAADLAERRGVRLWGRAEIERLRRNVAEKRGVRQRVAVEGSDGGGKGKKRGMKRRLLAIFLILCVAALYFKFFSLDHLTGSISHLRDLFEGTGLRDEELVKIIAGRAQETLLDLRDVANRISEYVTQKMIELSPPLWHRFGCGLN